LIYLIFVIEIHDGMEIPAAREFLRRIYQLSIKKKSKFDGF